MNAPSLRLAQRIGGHLAIGGSMQCRLVMGVQIDTWRGQCVHQLWALFLFCAMRVCPNLL